MLPLDKLTDAAEKSLLDAGISLDGITMAVRMDLDLDGKFGEAWLVYEKDKKLVHRLCADPKSIPAKAGGHGKSLENFRNESNAERVNYVDSFSMEFCSDLNIDTCLSSNRLLVFEHDTPAPEIPESYSKEEKRDILDEWNKSSSTIIKGYCTNAARLKLYAFCEIIEKLLRGESVNDDNEIFEHLSLRCPKCSHVYEDQKSRVCTHCKKNSSTVWRLIEYIKPHKFKYAFIILCMFACTALDMLNPILSGQILYDKVISPTGEWHSIDKLLLVLSLCVLIQLAWNAIYIMQGRVNSKIAVTMGKNMKQNVFDALMKLSLSYFNTQSTGKLINRVYYDAEKIRNFFVQGVPHNTAFNTLKILGMAIFLFSINWQLTLIIFIPVPIIIVIFRVMLPRFWRACTKQWRSSSSLNSVMGDSLNGIRVVKAFAKEAEETSRFYGYSEKMFSANLRVNMISLTIFPIVGLLISFSSQTIWGIGGLSVMGESMTYGEFVTYLGYIGFIFGPLQFFSTLPEVFTDTMNAAQRVFEILDMVPEIMDAPDAVDKSELEGDIEFKNVSFHYNPNRPILKNVDIKIKRGDNIGLVGHTGSGKSTIVNLITRMYDPISGQICIDGVDLKKLKSSSIRNSIAIVSQETFLFRGTIADNIRYARPDATMEEVIAAAKAANAHDFISRLPEAYETEVGTGSRSLSGGEKQRISIARALLLSPSILILDEATAAMDTETERLIGDALSKLVEGRTCITIAHRLSTLKDCNYLFVIENGEIAEEGPPDELLAKGGVYYKLYTLQSEAMKKVLAGM